MKEKTVHNNISITKLINFSLVYYVQSFRKFLVDFLKNNRTFFCDEEKYYLTFFSLKNSIFGKLL